MYLLQPFKLFRRYWKKCLPVTGARFLLVFILLELLQPAVGISQDPYSLPRLMDQTPRFVPFATVTKLPSRVIPLWIAALESKNINLQRQAAESVVLAVEKGYGNQLDPLKAALLSKLVEKDIDARVRIATAAACLALDLEQASEPFAKMVGLQQDEDLQSVIQPALAKWRFDGMVEHWREQLVDINSPNNLRTLAIKGLTEFGDKSVVPDLTRIVEEPTSPYALRFQAAHSLGILATRELVGPASRLQVSNSIPDRILCATLLRGHADDEAIQLLLKLAQDKDSTVCSIAWRNLLESSKPRSLDDLVDFGLNHREPNVRVSAVKLLGLWRSETSCQKLGATLSDGHPGVRNSSRTILLEFAREDALRPSVIRSAFDRLDSNWEGIQQALLLLTELDHKPTAQKAIDLVDHPRAEVHITAGWALERLSVLETLATIYRKTEDLVTKIKSGGANEFSKSQYESLAHLIQLLGKNRYRDMEKVIIAKLIPKDINIIDYPIRSAAIWSLGQIYDGKELPVKLRDLLLDRLLDDNPNDPESSYVKTMCAFTFAMTNCQAVKSDLENYSLIAGRSSRLGFYCFWALNRLDGRSIPPADVFRREDTDWFLVPLEGE